jgi:hypothetical protein
MDTAKRCYNLRRATVLALEDCKKKGKEKRNLICSFGERLPGRCVANPSALRGSALRRACLADEDAEEHS